MRGPALRLVCEHVLSVNNGITQYSNTTDANGLTLSIADLHNPQTLTHDARGRITRRNFASGRQVNYTYDDFDRILTITDNAGPSNSFVRDAMGKVLSQTVTPLSGGAVQATFYQYDARDRLTQVTDPKGQVTQFGYNIISVGCHVRDKVTSITDPAGHVEKREYDNRQRLTRLTDANNHVSRYEYNARGNTTAATDANGNRSTFSFDGNNRLVQETSPVVITGSSGGPVSATQVTNFSYDQAGRLMSTDKYALGVADAAHSTASLTYDPLDRVVSRTLTQGGVVQDASTFAYQRQLDVQKLTSASNGAGPLSFTYESAPPFLNSSFGSVQGTFNIARDTTGNIAAVTGPNGQLFTASFDPAGRMTGVQSNFNASNFSLTQTFDGFGRKSSITHSTGLAGSFSFDLLNQPTATSWSGFDGQAAQMMSENLGYDPAGNIVSMIRENGTYSFGYDPANRLVQTSYTGSVLTDSVLNRQLTLDATANRVGDSINGAGVFFANTILSDALHTYQTDSAGQGNVVQINTPSAQVIDLFTFRSDGALTGFTNVTDTNGNGAFDPGTDQVNTSAQYALDALGRRISKSIQGPSGSFTQSLTYLGGTNSVLLGTDGNGAAWLYFNGQHRNEHLASIGPNGVQAYVTDHAGSVLNTSIAGAAHAFGAAGETLGAAPTITASSDPAAFGWQGLRHDPESKRIDNFGREYNPITGGFMQRDPLGFAGGTMNLYESRNSNPLRFTDPNGLEPGLPGFAPSPTDIAKGILTSDKTGTVIGGTAGTAIGTVLGGTLGGIIGSAIGSAIGSLFDDNGIPDDATELGQKLATQPVMPPASSVYINPNAIDPNAPTIRPSVCP